MGSKTSKPKEEAVNVTQMTGNFDFPDPDTGLIGPEVERRRKYFGYNEVVEKKVPCPGLGDVQDNPGSVVFLTTSLVWSPRA